MSNINQDDLSFRYGPSKAYYFNHFHELTEQLRLGFLIFGITAAFIIYGDTLPKQEYQTIYPIILVYIGTTMLTIMFTAYDCIAGQIYMKNFNKDSYSEDTEVRAFVVVSTLLFNVLQFIFNAIIIVWPSITLKHNDKLSLSTILLINSIWHLTNLVWYCIEIVKKDREGNKVRKRDFIRHGSYTFLLFMAWSFSIFFKFNDYIIFTIYSGYIMCIYIIQVRTYIIDHSRISYRN